MFKKLAFSAVALVFCAATLFGGDCLTGTEACNHCPLAKQANARLATGHESLAVSTTVRADFVRTVLANLESI